MDTCVCLTEYLHCSPEAINIINQLCCCCRAAQSCLTLWKDCNMPGIPVLHHIPEFAQILVYWVGDAIQPSHSLSSPSPSAFNLSHHQGLFLMIRLYASGGQSIGASVSVLPMNIQGWFPLGLTGFIPLLSMGLLRIFSMFRCCSLETSHPRLLPQSLNDCSINLCLFSCSAFRVFNIFLNSIYMC